MLTTAALTGYKNYTKKVLSYARYLIGSTYYKTPITKIETRSDGKVAIDIGIDPSATGTVLITEIQIYDTSGQLWLSKTESTKVKVSKQGAFYRFLIDITEE